jgi:selenocysteine lyase/cysteine desulfurase
MQLDLDFIRSQFPAFSEPALAGQSFFENAGGSFTCRQVIDRLFRFYNERKVQPYAPYDASRLGGEEMDEARRRLSAMMGVHEDELSFGPSTTQNVYVLAKAFGEWMNEGEAIIVTNQDHEANSGAWRRLADRGIEVREWQINPETGRLDPSDLMNLLDDQVRLVCFPHCSNVVGEINPVVEITALAHGAGAFVCVDGVSYAPHGIPNVGDMGPDIYMKPMDPIRGSWWCAVNWQNCCPIRPIHSTVAASIKNSRPQDPIMHRLRPVRGWWIILMRWPPIMVARIYPHRIAEPLSTHCSERPKLPVWSH